VQFFTIRWQRLVRRPRLSPRVKVALMGFSLAVAALAGSAAQRWG
jgi:hypothetical protein